MKVHKALSYSASDARVLKTCERFRVAKQIQAVLADFLGRKTLRNQRILDVGCSSGVISFQLASFVKSLTGVDVDEAALSLARKSYKKKNLRFCKASGLNLPFRNASFDIVICNEVYSYVPDAKKLMSEIYRVLKIGGCCYFSGGNALFPIESRYHIPFLHNLPDEIATKLYWLLTRKQYYIAHYKTYWELKHLLKKFAIIDYTPVVLQNPYKFSFTKLYSVARITAHLPFPFLRFLELFGPTFIFMLTKDVSFS